MNILNFPGREVEKQIVCCKGGQVVRRTAKGAISSSGVIEEIEVIIEKLYYVNMEGDNMQFTTR